MASASKNTAVNNLLPPPPPYSSVNMTDPKIIPQNQPLYLNAVPISAPPNPTSGPFINPTIGPAAGLLLSHNPQPMQCPACRHNIVTAVHYENGLFAWLICLLICLIGGICGCCLIPFCMHESQDAIHTCPLCHTYLGCNSRM